MPLKTSRKYNPLVGSYKACICDVNRDDGCTSSPSGTLGSGGGGGRRRGGNSRRPGGAGVVGPYHPGSSVVVATVFCALGMLHLRCLRNLSFQSQTDLRVGVLSSQKIGLWRQKLNETKVLVHSQHLLTIGDAAQKRTRWNHPLTWFPQSNLVRATLLS